MHTRWHNFYIPLKSLAKTLHMLRVWRAYTIENDPSSYLLIMSISHVDVLGTSFIGINFIESSFVSQ